MVLVCLCLCSLVVSSWLCLLSCVWFMLSYPCLCSVCYSTSVYLGQFCRTSQSLISGLFNLYPWGHSVLNFVVKIKCISSASWILLVGPASNAYTPTWHLLTFTAWSSAEHQRQEPNRKRNVCGASEPIQQKKKYNNKRKKTKVGIYIFLHINLSLHSRIQKVQTKENTSAVTLGYAHTRKHTCTLNMK